MYTSYKFRRQLKKCIYNIRIYKQNEIYSLKDDMQNAKEEKLKSLLKALFKT